MNSETLQRLRAHRQSAIADTLGLARPSVWRWFRTGHIPAERVLDVERLTGIPRSDLRPDIYPPGDRNAA